MQRAPLLMVIVSPRKDFRIFNPTRSTRLLPSFPLLPATPFIDSTMAWQSRPENYLHQSGFIDPTMAWRSGPERYTPRAEHLVYMDMRPASASFQRGGQIVPLVTYRGRPEPSADLINVVRTLSAGLEPRDRVRTSL